MTSGGQEIAVVPRRIGAHGSARAHPSTDVTSNVGARVCDSDFEIEISQDLAAIEADWRVLEQDGDQTPFQTLAWLRPLYRELAPRVNAAPLFALVRNGVSHKPLLLMPLCVRRRFGFAFLEFADFGVCDYNAPILARGFEPSREEWRTLWSRIVGRLKGFASLMRLQKLPQRIATRANPLAHDEFAEPMSVGAWSVDLPDAIERYDNETLSSTFRKELAKKARRVARHGAVEWITASTAAERVALFETLARQRQARCDEMGRHNVLSEPDFRRFYDAATSDASHASLVRLNGLKVGGEIVASMLSLRHSEATHVIMTTFEGGDWKSASLGNVLIHEAAARSIADGVRCFDLTIGDEAYKRDFGATRTPLFSILKPLSPLGVALAAGVRAATRARARRIS